MGREIVTFHGERHVVTQCGRCAIWHTVPEVMWDTQIREGGFHACPNGHMRGWNKGTDETERENIRRERDRLKQEAARLEDERRMASLRAEEAEGRAYKAERAHRLLKKRTAAGTCPCCQRTFSNMSTHMKRQHPQFVADTGAKVVPIKAVSSH